MIQTQIAVYATKETTALSRARAKYPDAERIEHEGANGKWHYLSVYRTRCPHCGSDTDRLLLPAEGVQAE